MNTYTGVIAGLLFAVGAVLIAINTQDDLPVIDSNHAETMASLQKSQEHLDSMLAMAEQMHRDLIVMNQNSDAIFRSVTGCISDETCEAMKRSIIEAE